MARDSQIQGTYVSCEVRPKLELSSITAGGQVISLADLFSHGKGYEYICLQVFEDFTNY